MMFEMKKVLESKRTLRAELATLPFAEKLRLVEAMRERALAIKAARPAPIHTERKASSSNNE